MTRWTKFFFALLLLCLFALPQSPVQSQDIPEGSAEAISEFSQGMTFYAAQNYRDALPHLYKAHELDSSFVVSLFFAALCEGNLASGVPVDSLYRIVLAEKDRLSPYYVYRAEAQLAATQGDRERSYEFARKAANLAPGSKAWYNLAYGAVRMNRPAEARAALLRLDPTVEPMKGWAGYWGVLARANDALGRYEEVLQNAADFREAFPDRRGPFWWEINAYGGMGDVEGLNRVLEAAAQTPATGAANTVGAYMVLAAAELDGHGSTGPSDAMYRRAVEWYEEGGEAVQGGSHDSWHTLAFAGAGEYDDAKAMCEMRLAQNAESVFYNSMAGTLAARTGDDEGLMAAKEFFTTRAPDHYPGWLPRQMAYFLANEGRAEEAVASLNASMNEGYAFLSWWHRDPAFDLIRDHPAFQELIRTKG
jgi:predicted Zn-dependent protease